MNKFKKAFTLIELLVVIAIIAILATLAVVALQNSRASARDAKRLADVKQMQTALELYFNDNGSYPTSVTSTIATSGIVYMATIPTPPTPVDGDCTAENNSYTYSSDGSTYSITFCLGKQISGLSSGEKVLTRDGVSNSTSSGGSEGDSGSFACGDTFTDPRDSQQYPTVQIGTQCWMAKNMNYDNGCYKTSYTFAGNDDGYCLCYGNDANNCNTYGKLYQWSAANQICPSGWHLPSLSEINTFSDYIKAQPQYLCAYPATTYSGSGYSFKSIAATSSWATSSGFECNPGYNQSINNASGFNILAGGYYVSSYGYINQWAYFWTSTPDGAKYKNYYLMYDSPQFLNSTALWNGYAYSVRCLKD